MPFGPGHLYLPLQDANGNVYRNTRVWLIDPSTGAEYTGLVYSDRFLTEIASFPLVVTVGYVNLWIDQAVDVIVRVDYGPGSFDRYTSFVPSADQVARGEENLLIDTSISEPASPLTKGAYPHQSFFSAAAGGVHNHQSQGEYGVRMGALLDYNTPQYNSPYPNAVLLGQGYGGPGDEGVMLGQGERSPDAYTDFGEPSQEVLLADYGSYTPQSVWVGQRGGNAWDEGGRETTVLMRNTAAAYFLAPRATIIGGLLVQNGAYGDDHVWVGHTSPSADGVRHNTVYLGVSTLPANTLGYEGSVNIGTEPEALLWSGRANADPVDSVAIGIDGAVSDFLGNFVDYGVDGYAYDLGDEDPTVANPTPFFLRQGEVYAPGSLEIQGDAVVGNSELATATSDLLGFFGSAGAVRDSIATLPGDPPALLSLIAALTSYGLVISGEAPLLADSMNREDGLVGYAQTGQVRESVAVSNNGFWGEDVEIVTSVAKRSANYDATPTVSTYATPVSDVISEATIEAWGTGNTNAGLFIRGIYVSSDVVPIDGLLVGKNGLYKVEGGASLVFTSLLAYTAQVDGVVMRVEADANNVEVFADNVSLGSVVTTWCQTGMRHGYILGAGDAAISEFILYAL
jgi:hypothetical protein